MVAAGCDGEAAVEILAELGEIGIGAVDVGNTQQAQFLDQAVLEGLVGAFDAPLGLRGVGANDLDVQLMHRSSELGKATP